MVSVYRYTREWLTGTEVLEQPLKCIPAAVACTDTAEYSHKIVIAILLCQIHCVSKKKFTLLLFASQMLTDFNNIWWECS